MEKINKKAEKFVKDWMQRASRKEQFDIWLKLVGEIVSDKYDDDWQEDLNIFYDDDKGVGVEWENERGYEIAQLLIGEGLLTQGILN